MVTAATVLVTAACSSGGNATEPPPPRPVTVAESELLASVRFRNFDAGSRAVVATYTDQGHEIELEGWFDYTTHTGYGLLSVDGLPSDRVTWNGKVVATTTGTRLGKPLTSLDGWRAGTLEARNSPLSVVLTVLARFGADRPENPLLIRQGGALWLREDTTGGRAVTVFAGPTGGGQENGGADGGGQESGEPTGKSDGPEGSGPHEGETRDGNAESEAADPDASGIRYWVDDTGLAHRIDIRLGAEWAAVTLTNDDVRVPALLQNVDLAALRSDGGTTGTNKAGGADGADGGRPGAPGGSGAGTEPGPETDGS